MKCQSASLLITATSIVVAFLVGEIVYKKQVILQFIQISRVIPFLPHKCFQELAQVFDRFGTAGWGRTDSGHGDSLLPHGPLWGLHHSGANPVRVHEYDGFYEGSQVHVNMLTK